MRKIDNSCKAMYANDFLSFALLTFVILNPGQRFHPGYYFDEICEHLGMVGTGKLRRLAVSMPPRHLKSTLVSVAYPAWSLARNPKSRIVIVANSPGIRADLMRQLFELMEHPKYRSIFPHMQLKQGTSTILTQYGGSIEIYLVNQSMGGKGADTIIIDDPVSPSQALKPHKLDLANEWYDNNGYQRLNNKQEGAIIITMSRLGVNDMVGHVTRSNEWTHLCYPAVAARDEYYRGKLVRRKLDSLNPQIQTFSGYGTAMIDMGARPFMAQYQQAPYPEGQGDGKGGCHLPLRKGIPWKVGDPTPKLWFGTVSQEKIVLHEVFGVGDHPWPDDMRDTCRAERILVNGSDAQRYDLIQQMAPEKREALGIDPSGQVFPDFTQYNNTIEHQACRQNRVHNPEFRPAEGPLFRPHIETIFRNNKAPGEEVYGFEDPLPEYFFEYT